MIDPRRINSLTKYPSIPTYHPLDSSNGRLGMPPLVLTGPHYATEKIDGSNARIIFVDDGYYIGSREEILHWCDDRVWNPSQGIVDVVKPLSEQCLGRTGEQGGVIVLFGEAYGGKISANAKQYSGTGLAGWRLFDVMVMSRDELDAARSWSSSQTAAWRDHGLQTFLSGQAMVALADELGLLFTPIVWGSEDGTFPLPIKVADVPGWLRGIVPTTQAALDDKAGERAEGVVLRTDDRSIICKIRGEDYARTLRKGR